MATARAKVKQTAWQRFIAGKGVWFIWLLCGFAGAAVAWYVPRIVRIFGQDDSTPLWVLKAIKHDPEIGEANYLPRVYNLQGQTVLLPERGRTTCMVFLWHCDSCGLEKMIRALESLAKKNPNTRTWVVVVRGRPEIVDRYWKDNALTLPVAIDRSGDVARRLNVVFSARVYVFDPAGKLRYLSSYGENVDDILRRIEGVLRER